MDLKKFLKPQLCQKKEKPFDDGGYVFETKMDGERGIVFINKDYFRLQTRNSYSIENIIPELKDIPDSIDCDSCILDGEIVLNEGRTQDYHNEVFKRRIHIKSVLRAGFLSKLYPLTYIAFDILFLDGKDLRNEPLLKRKELLRKIVNENNFLKMCEFVEGNGKKFYYNRLKNGFEGIIAKKKNSFYETDRRSWDWIKIKPIQEMVVDIDVDDPINKGENEREILGSFNILHNGKSVGKVGSGLSKKKIEEYFRDKPTKILVKYQEMLDSKLRFPIFKKFIY